MTNYSRFGPFPIRIIVGIVFIAHSLMKLQDLSGTAGFLSSMAIPPELALPVTLLELIGGFCLIFGILTRISAILLIILMACTTLIIKFSKGFVGGYEIDLILLMCSISLLLTGPGRPSIEYDLMKREIFPKIKKWFYFFNLSFYTTSNLVI